MKSVPVNTAGTQGVNHSDAISAVVTTGLWQPSWVMFIILLPAQVHGGEMGWAVPFHPKTGPQDLWIWSRMWTIAHTALASKNPLQTATTNQCFLCLAVSKLFSAITGICVSIIHCY